MTEDEAKAKWCPFVRITTETENHYPLTNREEPLLFKTEPGSISRCLGSACMGWLWQDDAVEGRWTRLHEPPPGPEWVEVRKGPSRSAKFDTYWERPTPSRDGCCGLAAPRL